MPFPSARRDEPRLTSSSLDGLTSSRTHSHNRQGGVKPVGRAASRSTSCDKSPRRLLRDRQRLRDPGAPGSFCRRISATPLSGTTSTSTASPPPCTFPRSSFSDSSAAVGTIASFGALAGGFLARPVGGLVGGHIGDRYGRKKVLVASMIVMGISTLGVGALPSYHSIGIWAMILLVAARLLQGLGAGAEYGGEVLMVVEHFGSRRRGFWASLGNTGVFPGGVFTTLTFAVISRFPEEQQQFL
ncbi:MFS transporter [Streptomyces sp. NPDC094034]|uniref:MFS transporter n=1 Tax=Streptomyces sp. NPDC094034 TaxID=3155309 RepID=UPI00332DECD3